MGIAIWLDDMRDPNSFRWIGLVESYAPGSEIIWVKTYEEFISVVEEFAYRCEEENIDAIFFDNDLGHGKEGRHAFTWFENWVHEHEYGPVTLYAQTANLAARNEMNLGFEALRRYWNE